MITSILGEGNELKRKLTLSKQFWGSGSMRDTFCEGHGEEGGKKIINK